MLSEITVLLMTAYVLLSLTCLGFLIDQRYGSFILFYFIYYLLFI